MSIKLAYGLKDGKIVKVTNVVSGLDCGCICLDCKAQLIAVNKEGNLYRPHFRHYSFKKLKETIACTASQETAIHYLAKEIIEKNKSIILPSYCVSLVKHNSHGIRKHTIQNERFVKLDSVKNENNDSTSQGFQDIRPDLIAYYKNHQLFIEIFVSHPTGNEKIERFKELNVSAIEVDLSKFDRTANEEKLEQYLKKAPTKWLYHIKEKEFHQKALEIEQEKAKWAAFYAEKDAQEKRESYEKEAQEREIREAQEKEENIRNLRINFPNYFENNILNRGYRGNLLIRIERFIESKCNGYSYNNDLTRISCDMDEIDNVIQVSHCENNITVMVDFIGIPIKFSLEEKKSDDKKLLSFVVTNIYHEASKLFCNNLENKIFNQEKEFLEAEEKQKILEEKLKEEQRQKTLQLEQESVEREKVRIIEEQRKFEEKERIRKEVEKRKIYEENLVYRAIFEIYSDKKRRTSFNKEHPVFPQEVISKIRSQLSNFNEKNFIDARRELQNKNKLIRVEENKFLTAIMK